SGVAHDQPQAGVKGIEVEQFPVAVVPAAGFEVGPELLDPAGGLVWLDQSEARYATADGRIEVALGSPPVGDSESIEAVVGNRHFFDPVGLDDFGQIVD